ncbi:MAG: LysM peptidoglycan-binding domain-containing protein [Syntrophomonadaceae bacterium]|nr:LysM peptidoglycan-binding domain-containing protein [Syntrophomonadaceae bacterium]
MLKRSVLIAVMLISGALLMGSLFVAADAAMAATDTAGAYSERLLNVGTYGDDVKEVQRAMTHVNYDTQGIDGVYGNNTANAVSQFQGNHGLNVDGIAGPETQWVLFQKVKQIQSDLTTVGYSTEKLDGSFGPHTIRAVVSFQIANKLKVDGIVGPETSAALAQAVAAKKGSSSGSTVYIVQKGDTLFTIASRYDTTPEAIKAANNLNSDIIDVGQKLTIPAGSTVKPPAKPPVTNPPSRQGRYGEPIPWSQANKLFARGAVATVTDMDSGLTYQVKRRGGSNHADVEPLTAADTAKMKKAYGGSWSWTRHAILVQVGGRTLAASQHGMPHGGSSIGNNNFPGHFCIHFLGSKTHGGNQWASSPAHVDSAHQAMVRKAAGL